MSIAEFEHALGENSTASKCIVATVYETFNDWAPHGRSVHPSDDISEVYGMVDEDFDDAVRTILRRCSCHAPSWREARRTPRVHTIADLITLIDGLCGKSSLADA